MSHEVHKERCAEACDAARELADHFDAAANAPGTSQAAPTASFNISAVMKLLAKILAALGG